MKDMEYQFKKQEIKDCLEFSENVNTSLYSQRGQTNPDKRKKDAYIGKLGEIAAFNILKDKIKDISYPDFKIYQPKDKSWDFDLKAENFNIHVKSQSVEQGKRYGVSWLFQKGNGVSKHYDKEIFDRLTPNQYVAFMSVDPIAIYAELKAFISLDLLHEKSLFGEPKLTYLQFGNKCAVYYEELMKYESEFISLS